MRFASVVIVSAFIAVPVAARAQSINPLQAAGIATGVMRLVYGAMYPAPRCGPHDAPAPQPYQPPPRRYAPPPHPEEASGFDSDDDDEYQPIQPRSSRRLRADSGQPATRPDADDDSDQTAGVKGDSNQPNYAPVSNDGEDGQPAQAAPVRRRSTRLPAPAEISEPGQVAEIPSLPRAAQAPPADNQIYDPQP
jgi:hypothetical protein